MKIGSTELKHGLILAPMAGYTDRAMRLICKEYGAEYAVTEMVSAKAVVYGDKKTFSLAKIGMDECPTAIQIFGSEPDIMAKGAEELIRMSEAEGCAAPRAIDINMGCPVHKIFSNGEGSALMKDPELIYKITDAVRRAIDIPVTVKIRLGVDSENKNAVACALAAESGGASMIAVHGRTKSQLYGGEADMEGVCRVNAAVKVPVVANGDIKDIESLEKALALTGADGVMIGRAAVGNPFIFEKIIAHIEGREYREPTLDEIKAAALRQLSLAIEDKGERIAIPEARRQIANYFKGFSGCAALRAKINSALTFAEVEKAVNEIKQ